MLFNRSDRAGEPAVYEVSVPAELHHEQAPVLMDLIYGQRLLIAIYAVSFIFVAEHATADLLPPGRKKHKQDVAGNRPSSPIPALATVFCGSAERDARRCDRSCDQRLLGLDRILSSA